MLAATRMIGISVPDSRYSMDTRSGRYSTEDMAASRLRNFVNNVTLDPLSAPARSRLRGLLWPNILLPFNCVRTGPDAPYSLSRNGFRCLSTCSGPARAHCLRTRQTRSQLPPPGQAPADFRGLCGTILGLTGT